MQVGRGWSLVKLEEWHWNSLGTFAAFGREGELGQAGLCANLLPPWPLQEGQAKPCSVPQHSGSAGTTGSKSKQCTPGISCRAAKNPSGDRGRTLSAHLMPLGEAMLSTYELHAISQPVCFLLRVAADR